MKRKYLFDLLDAYPENIPQDSLFDDTGVDTDRIAKLVSDGTAADRKKPKMRFAKKYLLIAAAIVAVGSLTAAVVTSVLNFNMDQPSAQELRKAIIIEEETDYYDALIEGLDNYLKENEDDNWNQYNNGNKIEDHSYSYYNAQQTRDRKRSERVLDVLKEHNMIDQAITPKDVCDTKEQHKLESTDDAVKYCDYIDKCISLFGYNNLTEKERVLLQLNLEDAFVITFRALHTYKPDATGIGEVCVEADRDKKSKEILTITYNKVLDIIKDTVGKDSIDDIDALNKRIEKVNKAKNANLTPVTKESSEYDRVYICLLLSDYENNVFSGNLAEKSESIDTEYEKELEIARKEMEEQTGLSIPTAKYLVKKFKPAEGVDFTTYEEINSMAYIRSRKKYFEKSKKMLDRFNVKYDFDDVYYTDFDNPYLNAGKYYDFIILCAETMLVHKDEITEDELEAFMNVSMTNAFDSLCNNYRLSQRKRKAKDFINLSAVESEKLYIKQSKKEAESHKVWCIFDQIVFSRESHFINLIDY